MVDQSSKIAKIGDYRVSFQYYPCAEATIIAQQFKSDD